jgi:prolipoprotein diacylglyceryltransferase
MLDVILSLMGVWLLLKGRGESNGIGDSVLLYHAAYGSVRLEFEQYCDGTVLNAMVSVVFNRNILCLLHFLGGIRMANV